MSVVSMFVTSRAHAGLCVDDRPPSHQTNCPMNIMYDVKNPPKFFRLTAIYKGSDGKEKSIKMLVSECVQAG
jgi:hypothetical protein